MFTVQIDHMNLHQIANSGQCFRWKQIEDNSYIIPAYGKELTISQDGNTFILSCGENEWNSLWRNYFDVDTDTDYNEVENIIMESNDDFLKAAYEFGSGIRILRQDLWEVIISFIISQNNNIPRIKKSIQKICDENNGKFPEWYDLINMNLADKGLGYRDEYIRNACYAMATMFTDDDLESGYANAKAQLMKIKGIGEKVSNCVLLFFLHYLDSFPVDVHIKRILDREYCSELPDWAFGKYAGLFQQYLFYYEINGRRY